jgi:sensor histidine kinase YesM
MTLTQGYFSNNPLVKWSVVYLFFLSVDVLTHQSIDLFTAFAYVLSCLAAYVNVSFLIPIFLNANKKGQYAFFLLLAITSLSLLKRSYGFFLNGELDTSASMGRLLFPTIVVVGSTTALHFLVESRKAKERVIEIEKERLSNELNYLKMQLNPHFFFNSINCIFHLIDIEKEQAKDALLKMSDLLRFQLYECNQESIEIEREIAFIKNYVEFESVKKLNEATINLEIDDFPVAKRIAPLILIPFVENSFKHVSKDPDRTKNIISIKISMNDAGIHFECNNTISVENKKLPKGGLGINNVTKRLELTYDSRFHLSNSTTNNWHKTDLRILW